MIPNGKPIREPMRTRRPYLRGPSNAAAATTAARAQTAIMGSTLAEIAVKYMARGMAHIPDHLGLVPNSININQISIRATGPAIGPTTAPIMPPVRAPRSFLPESEKTTPMKAPRPAPAQAKRSSPMMRASARPDVLKQSPPIHMVSPPCRIGPIRGSVSSSDGQTDPGSAFADTGDRGCCTIEVVHFSRLLRLRYQDWFAQGDRNILSGHGGGRG